MQIAVARIASARRSTAEECVLSTTRFRVNVPGVIHQLLDGEVIVVNLDTGTYYSLAESAADIWTAVEGGASVDETVDELLGRYEAVRPDVETAVTRFVHELEEEELIVAADRDGSLRVAASANGADKVPLAEPTLHKFTDMQELLLLDPIHEVDERGWPNSLDGGVPASTE
jgi:Coenzyme PQQ synthesis protein D (PqqD)